MPAAFQFCPMQKLILGRKIVSCQNNMANARPSAICAVELVLDPWLQKLKYEAFMMSVPHHRRGMQVYMQVLAYFESGSTEAPSKL